MNNPDLRVQSRYLQVVPAVTNLDTPFSPALNQLLSLLAQLCQAPVAALDPVHPHFAALSAYHGPPMLPSPALQPLHAQVLRQAGQVITAEPALECASHDAAGLESQPRTHFYAGTAVLDSERAAIATLYVLDDQPHTLSSFQQQAFYALAQQVAALYFFAAAHPHQSRELRLRGRLSFENRRTAFLAQLGQRALRSRSLAGLLDWTVRQLLPLLAADHCCILEILPDSSKLLLRSSAGTAGAVPLGDSFALASDPFAAYTLQQTQPISLSNSAVETRFDAHSLFEQRRIVSGVNLPIRGRQHPYGLLGVYRSYQQAFTGADVRFLQTVTAQLAEAIDRLWRERELKSIVILSHTLRRAVHRSEMLDTILVHLRMMLHCRSVAIILRRSETEAEVVQASGSWARITGSIITPSAQLSWSVMLDGQPVLGDGTTFEPVLAAQLSPRQPRVVACVPLVPNGQAIGVIWIGQETLISEPELHLLRTIADTAASAIYRADLHDQTVQLYHQHARLSEEVQRAERHLASIVDSASDMVVSADSLGLITTWNRAAERISGFPKEQMIGQSLASLCPQAQQTQLNALLEQLRSGAQTMQAELPLLNQAGQEVPISWRISALQTDSGTFSGVVAVGRDLAAQRRLEAQLYQSAKMASMGVMASGIGHELRNPLGIISASAQLAEAHLDDVKLIGICMERIHTATKRAALIIDNLLTFARPRSMHIQPVDINDVLETTFALLDHQLQPNQIRPVKLLDRRLGPINGNPALLQQVFTNLIQNACQAMPNGGLLVVKTSSLDQGGIFVSVRDTGCGIAPEHLPRIFDPFFTTRPIGQGTGLGLAISYSIIQQHGGSIEVQSQLGAGSTFTVCLPAQPALSE